MKWWQKKVRGWIVPFWYTDTPLYSKRFAELSDEQKNKLADDIRKCRRSYQDVEKWCDENGYYIGTYWFPNR